MKLKEKIISFIPIYGSRYFKKKAEKEIKAGEAGIIYNAPGQNDPDGKKFQEFLIGLPKYEIEDNLFASRIRSLMKVVGAEYKQVVLINKADISDKKLWIRKKGDYFIHDKGTYFNPWVCVKDIFYWDIVDSRPLIDMTDDMDWYNPEMCAEVVTAVTNTNQMRNLSDDSINSLAKSINLLLIIVAVGVGATLVGIYLDYKNNEVITNTLTEIIKRLQ